CSGWFAVPSFYGVAPQPSMAIFELGQVLDLLTPSEPDEFRRVVGAEEVDDVRPFPVRSAAVRSLEVRPPPPVVDRDRAIRRLRLLLRVQGYLQEVAVAPLGRVEQPIRGLDLPPWRSGRDDLTEPQFQIAVDLWQRVVGAVHPCPKARGQPDVL